MIVWALYRDKHTAFGEYNNEELLQMKIEGWCIAYSVDLAPHYIKRKKRKRHVQGRIVGVNKNGIRVMQ